MLKYEIDASKFDSRADAHREMKKVFEGREYYGNSLDALYDVLTTIFDDCEITVKSLNLAEDKIGVYAKKIRTVFEDAAEENEHIKVTFVDGKKPLLKRICRKKKAVADEAEDDGAKDDGADKSAESAADGAKPGDGTDED